MTCTTGTVRFDQGTSGTPILPARPFGGEQTALGSCRACSRGFAGYSPDSLSTAIWSYSLRREVRHQRRRSLLTRIKTGPAANEKVVNDRSTVTDIETE